MQSTEERLRADAPLTADDLCALYKHVMRINTAQDSRDAQLIEPSLLQRVVEESESAPPHQRYQRETLRQQVLHCRAPLILFPVLEGAHWSLLALRRDLGLWYHCDPACALHSAYMQRVVYALMEARVMESAHRLQCCSHLPCRSEPSASGLYVLAYISCMVATQARRLCACDALTRYLERELAQVCDNMLPSWTTWLVQALE